MFRACNKKIFKAKFNWPTYEFFANCNLNGWEITPINVENPPKFEKISRKSTKNEKKKQKSDVSKKTHTSGRFEIKNSQINTN